MKARYTPIRARLVVVVTLLFAALAFGMVYVQYSVIGKSNETLHSSQRMSSAQLVKLYLDVSYPGYWTIVDGKIRKGGRDFGDGSYLTYALSDYLFHDTLIRFNAGAPPILPKNKDLGDLLVEPSKPNQADRLDQRNLRPEQRSDRPFLTATGAGIAVRDDAGLPVGWIEVASDHDRRSESQNRVFSNFLIGGTILSLAIIVFFCVAMLQLTRPIDLMAEESEAAKARSEELSAISKTDPLTRLYNRRGLEAALGEMECVDSPPSQIALVDIDHFKAVNDSRGHDEGDRVLTAIASLIASSVRACDLCCRWGGEEFVIVFRGLENEHASTSAERLRQAVEEHAFGTEDEPLRITVTIGLAQWRSGGFGASVALSDSAMYRGKREGRNRVVIA
jgi:diguanylate cyclase (GGDEF)-like protein